MRILVTGAGGFLGRAVVQTLQSARTHEVLPLYRRRMGAANEIVSDLNEYSLRNRLPAHIDLVIHAAAYVPEKEAAADLDLAMKNNAEATLRLLEYSVKAGVKRFIYASSAAVYGSSPSSGAITETAAPRPDNPYALSKLAGELMIEPYRFVHGVETIGLRFSYIYGKGMRANSVVKKFSALAKSHESIPVFNSGNDFFDLLHISDAVRAVEFAMARGSGIFNIGSGKPTSVFELATTAIEVSGSRSQIEQLAAADKYHSKYLDISRAAAHLGWFPRVSLHDGLKNL